MKISILSAVWNEEEHIDSMIESVVSQNFDDWELIIVSDGSTDRTVDMVERWAQRDARIRLVGNSAKVGKVEAFNVAFNSSRGAVIMLLAGDDLIPPGSLRLRHDQIQKMRSSAERPVAFFKLRTFSHDPKQDGLILPRGARTAAHSGGTWTASRNLASQVFPVPSTLVSEDLWICHASEGLCDAIEEVPEVVLHYRIHEGNSNPRNSSFEQQSRSFAARHAAFALLASDPRPLHPVKRNELRALSKVEAYRAQGRTLQILRVSSLPLTTRLAFASQSHRFLASIRRRFYAFFSGRQAR